MKPRCRAVLAFLIAMAALVGGVSPGGAQGELHQGPQDDTPEITSPGSSSGTWGLVLPHFARSGHSAICDPIRDRMIVFGGRDGGFSSPLRNDVLALPLAGGQTWTTLATAGPSPPGRTQHTAIYDSRRDRMVVFGGNSPALSNDVWVLSLSGTPTWARLTPAGTPPSPRFGHSAIYDPVRDRMVVFGGYDGQTLNDTWELSLGENPAWSLLPAGGTAPRWRYGHSAVYDPSGDRMIICGGLSGGVPYSFVSILSFSDGQTWSDVTSVTNPPPGRYGHTAAWDPDYGRMLVFGGDEGFRRSDDVWILRLHDQQPAWFATTLPGPKPTGRMWHSMVFDPARSRVMVFGGENGMHFNDVWILRGEAGITSGWARITPPDTPPSGRIGHSAIYDPLRDRMLVFGGAAGVITDEVWGMELGASPTSTLLAPTGTPPAGRIGHSTIYDPVRDRMLAFGGRDNLLSGRNDVWALSLTGTPAWIALAPSGVAPPVRYDHSAIYDPVRDRMIVFAGFGPLGYLYDIWSLSLGQSMAWTQISPGYTPFQLGPRYGHTAVYDSFGDRMVVYGGADGSGDSLTWALSLQSEPTWTILAPSGPGERRYHTAIYDPLRNRMVIFGGLGYPPDAWGLSLGASPAWTALGEGTPPTVISNSAVYDARADRMIVFGGVNSDGYTPCAVWALDWGQPVSALVSLASAEASPGLVSLTWYGAEAPGQPADVQRRRESSDWETIGGITADGTRRFRYVDRAVTPGSRYAYRLAYLSDEGEQLTAEHWVTVPVRSFALLGFHPNPAGRVPMASFALPDDRPALLEVFDLGGRRVAALDVGDFGPGQHRLRLAEGAGLRAGIYVLRLTQANLSATARGVVLP